MTARFVILHDDAALYAVSKPSGVLVHRGMGQDQDHVLSLLARQGEHDVRLVHRLDRATSGVLLLARTAEAARAVCRSFERGECDKRYLALVRGAAPTEVLVDHAIPADEGAARVAAQTSVRCLATVAVADSPLRESRYSLVRAVPHGGRFHQVRRHLKHLGHPIVGDANYGRSEHNRFCDCRFGLGRLALHAVGLELPHPAGGRLRVQAPLPEELAGPLARMGFGELLALSLAELAGW